MMNRRSFLKGLALLPFAKYIVPKIAGNPWNDIIPSSTTEVGPWMGYIHHVRTWDWTLGPEEILRAMNDCDCEFDASISYAETVLKYKPILYRPLWGEEMVIPHPSEPSTFIGINQLVTTGHREEG